MNNEYFSSINDVSKRLDLPAHTLRYWEKQFPIAIKPTTGAGGRRYYRPETVQALETIKGLLYSHGMTIAGVKKLLRDDKFPDVANPMPVVPEQVTAIPKASPELTRDAGLFSQESDVTAVIDLLERARAVLA